VETSRKERAELRVKNEEEEGKISEERQDESSPLAESFPCAPFSSFPWDDYTMAQAAKD